MATESIIELQQYFLNEKGNKFFFNRPFHARLPRKSIFSFKI